MPIIFHEKEKEFHIYNETISYIMKVMPNGMLANLHYGHRVKDHEDFSYLMEETYRPSNVNSCPVGEGYCLQHIKQEYPAPDIGDFRNTAFMIRQENGSHVSRFEYSTHVIYNGKKQLEGLPATYVEHKKEATSIDITMYDSVTDTNMILTYTIYERLPAITRSVRFEQKGIQTVRLTKALSACVDLHGANFEMIQLSGAWGRERNVKVRKLEQGVQSISSIRGASSAEHNPFLALKRPKSDEFSGEVYGFSLIYSGNFIGEVEVSTHD